MTRAGIKKRIGKCTYKTNKGNVYESYSEAKLASDNLGKWKKIFVEPYYCDICKKFHVGKAFKTYSFPKYQDYGVIQFLGKMRD